MVPNFKFKIKLFDHRVYWRNASMINLNHLQFSDEKETFINIKQNWLSKQGTYLTIDINVWMMGSKLIVRKKHPTHTQKTQNKQNKYTIFVLNYIIFKWQLKQIPT